MTLEWLRRRDPALDTNLRAYLFTTEPILEIEKEAEGADTGAPERAAARSLGIGSLKGVE